MTTLAEIEKAAEALSPDEKERLILFLAARLRSEGVRPPPPRALTREQIDAWIAEDEAELRTLKRGGVRLFLDTSVLLAASGSASGASRHVFRVAPVNGWWLVATPYVVEEVLHNLPLLPAGATSAWGRMRSALVVREDVLTLDRAALFPASKDRPVLFGALAWADVLLTLDKRDFGELLGGEFYGLAVLTPGAFLGRERAAGRLIGL